MGKVIFGGIIGAIVVFIWSFVSWSVLPWHKSTINTFCNQEFVSWVIKENTKKDGVYIAPYFGAKEMSQLIEKDKKEKKDAGAFIYAQVKRKGINYESPRLYIISFLTQFVGAALICSLLMKAPRLRYAGRLLFVTTIGLIVGILGEVPNWNWFGAGNLFAIVMIVDLVIAWFLAGLALAAFVKPSHEHERMM